MEEKEMKIGPMVFESIEDETDWGSESWKLADLGFRDSCVSSGNMAGDRLGDIMETYMDKIVGEYAYSYTGRQFPVMVKTFKTTSLTPLLVCPDDVTAAQRYDSLGKMKLWYVTEVRGDAKLYIGLKRDVEAAEFYSACLDGSIIDCLNEIPVKAGDSFLIKPGTVHCAGSGVSLVEIAESSDLDLRICEWSAGSPDSQETFLEEAFDFVNMGAEIPNLLPKVAKTEQFELTRLELQDPLKINNGDNGSYSVYYCLNGSLSIQMNVDGHQSVVRLETSQAALVPAEVEEFFLSPCSRDTVIFEIVGGKHKEEELYQDYGDSSQN